MHYLCYALFGSEILDLCFWTRVYLLYYWNAFRAKNERVDRKSTRLNSSHSQISYAVFCLKKKTVHCIERANDGLVYVCDRQNDRLQVFTAEGKFVKEAFYARNTLSAGSVWDITISTDAGQ